MTLPSPVDPPPVAGCIRENAVGDAEALQPDGAVASQGGEEQAFTAEDHALEIAGTLDFVIDPCGHRDEAPRIDAQRFAAEFPADDRPAGMNEGETISLQALQVPTGENHRSSTQMREAVSFL
jgi:hypothetical protein